MDPYTLLNFLHTHFKNGQVLWLPTPVHAANLNLFLLALASKCIIPVI